MFSGLGEGVLQDYGVDGFFLRAIHSLCRKGSKDHDLGPVAGCKWNLFPVRVGCLLSLILFITYKGYELSTPPPLEVAWRVSVLVSSHCFLLMTWSF